MKVIIAGSRELAKYEYVSQAVNASGFPVSEVISGTARGIDVLGEKWAAVNGIPVSRKPADWDRFGKAAGYIRNKEMAKYAKAHNGAAIVIWDGVSKGSKHMIDIAQENKLPCFVYLVENPNLQGRPMDEVKYLPAAQFLYESGLLFHINRMILHPVGLALEIVVKDDGRVEFGRLLDCRNDPEGILYEESTMQAAREKIDRFMFESGFDTMRSRQEKLGYVVQPLTTAESPDAGNQS